MLREIKACLFDMDGTLIDSMGLWEDIDIDFFEKYSIDMPSTFQKDIEGWSILEIAEYVDKNFDFPLTKEQMIDEWNDMAFEHYSKLVPYKEGAKEFLVWCKENGIKVGIATSNSTKLFDAVSTHLDMHKYIDAYVTGEDVTCGKPNPECYLRVAEKLNVEPKECIVFEDLVLGLHAGNDAGMRTCAVKDAYSLYQDEDKRKEADYYIESFLEIL